MKSIKDERVLAAMAGQYQWRIRDVIKESWKKVKGSKGSYWGAFGILLAIMIGLSFVLLIISGIGTVIAGIITGIGAKAAATHSQHPPLGFIITSQSISTLGQLIINFIQAPLIAGLIFMGIRRAIDKPISFVMLFKVFKFRYMFRFFYLNILILLIIFAGVAVIYLPGLFIHNHLIEGLYIVTSVVVVILAWIYLFTSFILTFPLIIDRDYTAWAALTTSCRAVSKHWFRMFGLLIVLQLIYLLTALTLFIGFIWTLPFFLNTLGVVYRDTFGVVGLAVE